MSADGVIFTALHSLSGAAELQVRLPGGDVYDSVALLGVDRRRDIAAIKIPASNLSALQPATRPVAQGDAVYAVTNAGGLSWSASDGIVSAIRPADEVDGAGSGFRLIQFTAPVSPGASGGALLDATGGVIGIITSGKGNTAFAVPFDSVAGLKDEGVQRRFGSGAALQLPKQSGSADPSSSAIAGLNPDAILRDAKTIVLQSKTSFLTVDTLDHELRKAKGWNELGLVIVQDPKIADLLIQVDRPLFTYIHTFVIVDKKTSIVLGSGRQTAIDGTIASSGLAKDIVKIFRDARTPGTPVKKVP